jgi:putative membrane protein
MFAAVADVWRYQFHAEVWFMLVGVISLGWYTSHVIGPKVVPADEVTTPAQRRWFAAAVVLLWMASDWPIHDIAEEYLYWVHMVQHLLITLVIPAMFLLALPEWLARLVFSPDGVAGKWIRRLAHPIVAGVLFNVLIAVSHAPILVNYSVENGPFHYAEHLAIFLAALLMWTPVCGPLHELRMKLPMQMVYIFLMSVIPVIPGAWLTFADDAVYKAYDHDVRLWGVSVTHDQQAAGMIMKVVAGTYLWSIIGVLFYRWSKPSHGTHRTMRKAPPKEATKSTADVS